MAGQTTNYLFDYPTSTDYVKDGATAIQTLATDVDTTLFTALGGAYPGLRLVKKQTIGSAVSSVTVTGAFSATYENYKIVVSGGVCSVDGNEMQMRLGSTTTNYYFAFTYSPYASPSPASVSSNNTVSFFNYVGNCNTNSLSAQIEINNPFLTKNTSLSAFTARDSLAGNTVGLLKDTTSYTAFTLYPSSGTLTGGTIYVYGYGAS